MTFAHVGDIGTSNSTTANQATQVMTTTATLEAGNVCILIIAVDNRLTTDGDDLAVSGVTDSAGNKWSKAIQFANGQGTNQAGASNSIWFTRANFQLNSGGTITATFTTNTLADAAAMTAKEFTMDANKRLQLVATATLANDAAAAGSLNATTPNVACLRVRGIASESNSTTVLTATSTWTIFTQAVANSGTAATSMGVRGEWLISTATGAASAPTGGAGAVDNASVYAAFIEADIGEGGKQFGSDPVRTFAPRERFGAMRQRSHFAMYSQWLDVGFENQAWQPPQPRNKTLAAAIMQGIDSIEKPYVFTAQATPPWGYDQQAFQPPAKVSRQAAVFPKEDGTNDILRNFFNYGFENQSWQPPHQFKERRGAILIGDDGTDAPFVPPVAVVYQFESQLAPSYKVKHLQAMQANFNIDQFYPPLSKGWELSPWQPPETRTNKYAGAIMRGEDGLDTFKNFVGYGFHIQPWQPPHQFKEKRGAFLIGDDGTDAPFVAVQVVVNFVDPAPFMHKRFTAGSRSGGIAFSSEFMPFQLDPFGWETQPPQLSYRQKRLSTIPTDIFTATNVLLTANYAWNETPWVYPRQSKEKRGTAIVKEDGIEFPFIRFVDHGWPIQSVQPPHPRREKWGALAPKEDGNEGIFFQAVLSTGAYAWFETPWVYPRVRNATTIGAAVAGRSDFVSFQLDPVSWEIQPWQPVYRRPKLSQNFDTLFQPSTVLLTAAYSWTDSPWVYPRKKVERAAAIMPREDGIESPFRRFFDYGFHVQEWQPPHPRRERWGALAPKEDGNEFLFFATPVLLTAQYSWYETPWVYPRKNFERWASLAPKEDGIEFPFIRFFDYGWPVQHVQPPHPRSEKWGAIVPKEDGTEYLFFGTPVLITGQYAWYETPWVYPRKNFERWSAILPKDDGIQAPYRQLLKFGFEVQSWQPPHLRPEKSASLMKGDEGTQDRYRQFFDYGYHIQSWQPPHPRREKAATFMRGDEGNQGKYVYWADYGYHIQPWQPPAFRAGTKGLFMRGDNTPDTSILRRFFSYGPFGYTPPMLRQVWRQGARSAVILEYAIRPFEILGQVITPWAPSIRYVIVDSEDRSVLIAAAGTAILVDDELRSIEPDAAEDEVEALDEDREVDADDEDREVDSTDL